MSNDNYPAGVTDAHPHFNPSEVSMEVECESEEALVVPSFAIKAELHGLKDLLDKAAAGSVADADLLTPLFFKVGHLTGLVDRLEREGEYECQWKGEQELALSEEAEWDCPRCGNTNSTDTLPEDRDPDEGWDNRYDE